MPTIDVPAGTREVRYYKLISRQRGTTLYYGKSRDSAIAVRTELRDAGYRGGTRLQEIISHRQPPREIS